MKHSHNVTAFFIAVFILFGTAAGYADEEEETYPTFKIAVSLGAIFYTIAGDATAESMPVRYKILNEALRPGFTGGFEAMLFPHKDHALSLGAFYEQRIIHLRLADVFLISLLPGYRLEYLLVFPVERFVSETECYMDYVNFPLTYRVHFKGGIYLGFGVDFAVLARAKAGFLTFIADLDMEVRKYFNPFDFGGRMILGINIKGFFLELTGGCSILDMDTLSGVRRSAYAKFMLGYRI